MQPTLLTTQSSSLILYPERGGIISSLKFGKREILFQDMLHETLFDTSKSVRGGIPILFPNSGALTQEEIKILGHKLSQHGFLRNTSDFEIVSQSENSIILEYKNTVSNTIFPYDFIFLYEILLGEKSLTIKSSLNNIGNTQIPIAPGFHPYFPINKKNTLKIFSQKQDYTQQIQANKNLWENGGTLVLEIKDCRNLTIESDEGEMCFELSDDFSTLLIWSLPEKNFVCIEPVFGTDGMIATNPILILPGKQKEYSFSIFLS